MKAYLNILYLKLLFLFILHQVILLIWGGMETGIRWVLGDGY